ncbi:hypothetical protein AB1Y20_015453 [Prymnesium parvum]|uniref:Uncharacterized protein n=1 Tax=Prymnesium parvum TaxID=97485 RepID=A0AB34K0X7_PRYPA
MHRQAQRALGPTFSSMCSHQVTTFVRDEDYYPPGSDQEDLAFREYLAESGTATKLVKALVELLETTPSAEGSGATVLGEALACWCAPRATGGGLVRGEMIEDGEALLEENRSLRARLDALTHQLNESKEKLCELIPISTLSLTSIAAEWVPYEEDDSKPSLFVRVSVRDATGLIEPPAPIETLRVPNCSPASWDGLSLVLPAGLARSSTTLAMELCDEDEVLAFGELNPLPSEAAGAASIMMELKEGISRMVSDTSSTLQLTFDYSNSFGAIDL